ncbi:unnamed protein product [Fusarium venenatum]|uniref:Uncharacterized protein n=1 Tax=Fusarium venenatum TaxID=56646 RepID=A0A2L2ST84_9HYPO|nr:uncharacterized protein FVRRES_13212 [Fusarium venenatum]CEI40652.1 unnamed protein product [Fusarium venenatum]
MHYSPGYLIKETKDVKIDSLDYIKAAQYAWEQQHYHHQIL